MAIPQSSTSKHVVENRIIPLITVILTVFKRTEYLELAILSVLQQTFDSLEVLVTDDANQAKARAICEKFGSDGRVRYRSNSNRLGVPLNIAAALSEARGKYIAILNDDDILYPEMFEHLVKPLEEHPGIVVSCGNHDVIDPEGKVLLHESKSAMRMRLRNNLGAGLVPDPFGFALRGGLMVGMGCLCRKSAIESSWLVNEVAGAYDYWLAVKLASKGGFYFDPIPVMAWRQHANSATATASPGEYLAAVYIYDRLCSIPLNPELLNCATELFVKALCQHAFLYLEKEPNVPAARMLLRKSLAARWRFGVFCYWLATFVPAKLCVKTIQVWRARRAFINSPLIVVFAVVQQVWLLTHCGCRS